MAFLDVETPHTPFRLDLVDYPLLLEFPDLIDPTSGWLEHIPFAFLLVELAEPNVLVELGTHGGVSYCAFCQAVKQRQLPTRCFAVDTWKGDAHSGPYEAQVLGNLRAHHDPLYASFSSLVQMTFDEAQPRFADGEIDILHIDGLHTYDAVRHDFENWKPKLSDAGIVLFHDTMEMQKDFGVYKLWAELAPKYPSFQFEHCHGLGVLAVGQSVPARVRQFLEYASVNAAAVRNAFFTMGSRHTLNALIITLFHQQQMINDWKRRTGMPVEPATEKFRNFLANPNPYARYAAKQIKAMIDLDLKRRGHEP